MELMAIDKNTITNLLEYLDAEIRVIENSKVTKDVLDKEERSKSRYFGRFGNNWLK